MTTCHQCGSNVAENDVFCPFCGISLAPVGVPDAENDEFASTIMMPQPEKTAKPTAEPVPVKVDAKPVEEQHHEPASQESKHVETEHVEPVHEPEVVIEPTVVEPLEPAVDYSAMPTPPALQELEKTSNTTREPEPVHEFAAEPQIEASAYVEEPKPEPVEDVVPVVHAAEPASEPERKAEPELEPEPEPSPVEKEIAIARPENILEEPEPEPSKFDSVRIMDDRFTPTSPRSETPLAEEPEPVEQKRSTGLARNHTGSGMGLVDTDGRRAAKLKPLDEGIVLNNRYEIVRKIGGGGMGAVYLASDDNLGGVLRAVKEMVQSHIEEEQQDKAIEDFKRESVILSSLDHPSIPTIYDYFFDEVEGRFYLVMKYISGGDLATRLRAAPEGRIDEKTVTEWGIQIADVLDYLHNQPQTIVYRDLKPSNIMIDGNSGRVMLIDFGIARSINQKQEKGVTAVGTMGYAPPELFSGNVEPRSDIYSLGSTMFHLMTGADPQSNPLLIFDFQKNPRPRQINPQLSDQIERFIMRSVEYNAASRFESAAEVRQFLTEHLANLNKGTVTFGVKEAPESVSLANQPVFCGFCGQRIVATDLFCAFCGAKQPIAQQGVHSEIYGSKAVTAKLVVEGTSELHTPMFNLDKGEILIGRRDPMSNIFPEVDLSKYDPQTKISRRHARIWREGNTFLLEDLGSSNGTVLVPIVHDSLRLPPRQPHALTNGDKIRVGDTTLHFVVG
jgi:serine/threonine-protein kinase